MREARIITPRNIPLTQEVRDALHDIRTCFGGCTEIVADGEWKSPTGEFLHEPVTIFDIAYDATEKHDKELFTLAQNFRTVANQVEVYLRYGSGYVQLVSAGSDFPYEELFDYAS